MFRKCMSLFLVLLMVLSMTGAVAETAVTVTDMTGREITLTEPATRIVALTASDCEILYALGAGDLLVGRGEYCDYPEAVLALPAVQSGVKDHLGLPSADERDVVDVRCKSWVLLKVIVRLDRSGNIQCRDGIEMGKKV